MLTGEAYEKEVDMWSVGVITYILLCGFPPFFDDGSNMGQLFEQIMSGDFDYPEEYWDEISDEGKPPHFQDLASTTPLTSLAAKDLIDNLLLVDPAKRFTAKQALAHPWLQGAASDHELGVPGKMGEFTKKK